MEMEAIADATPAFSTMPMAPSKAAAGEAENIAVCIRVRPLNERELRSKDAPVLRSISKMNLISITDTNGQPMPGKHNVFQYDHIFDETASTRAMYNQVAQRIVTSALNGINGTIFAYGQTSSGKTYTMTGTGGLPFADEDPADQLRGTESMGILQLAVEDIFSYIERSTDHDFLLRVSFVEIYNEDVRDLLNTNVQNSKLKLREDPRKGVYVDSSEKIITNYEDILHLLHEGNQRRAVGQTAMNERSSRSHSIFRIVIESKEKSNSRRHSDDVNGAVLVASLNLVDLAGSESVRHTAAEGSRQREAGNINKSLLTLSRVINALASSGGAINAPFRDSKLTRLLQTSLDGNTRTLIICCVTPSDRFLEETKSTLQFAARAKTIQTSAYVNEVMDEDAQLKLLKREIHTLKRSMKGEEGYNQLMAENEAYKSQIMHLKGMMLSSKSDGVRGISSARKARKRMRETWHPGDFPAHVITAKLAEPGSPNPQSRKRLLQEGSKENINPQNLMSELDVALDDEDDLGTSMRFRLMSDENQDPLEVVSRRRQMKKATDEQVLHLVQRLERIVYSAQPEDELEEDSELDPARRIERLMSECAALVSAAQDANHIAGEHEVTKMAVEELRTRLQLSSDREQQDLLEMKTRLAESVSDLGKKDEAIREEQAKVTSLQEELAKLQKQLDDANSVTSDEDRSSSREQELERNMQKLLQQNKELAVEVTRLEEVEDAAKKEIGELGNQLQNTFVEQEEMKLEKDEEIAKLEEELLVKSDELEKKCIEFAQRETELLEGTQAKNSVTERCEELQAENERVEGEKFSLMDAQQQMEDQLRQAIQLRVELEERLAIAEDKAPADAAEQSASKDQLMERIAQLERELAQAQEDLLEAGNDQEAEANRADEVTREMHVMATKHADHLAMMQEELSSYATQARDLNFLLTEKEETIKQAQAAEAEARGYRDFLQAEMDELSQKAASFETIKSQLSVENTQMRQQLSEVNKLANEIEGLTECIESLQADLDIKTAKDKQQTSDIKKLTLRVAQLDGELALKIEEVDRLQDTIQSLDEEKSVWLQKGATSDELQAEIVRMREERWGLATKWEESDRALAEERRQLERVTAELQDLQAEYRSVEDELLILKKAMQEKDAKLRQVVSELDATNTEKEALEDMVGELDSKFEVLALAKKTLDESLTVRMAEVTSKTSENEELRAKLTPLANEIDTLKKQGLSLPNPADGVLRDRIASLESRCEALEQEKNSLADDAKMAMDGKSALLEELGALEAQLMMLSEEKMELQSKLDAALAEAQERVTQMEEQLQLVQSAHGELQRDCDSLTSTLKEKDEMISARASTVDMSSPDLQRCLEDEQRRRSKAELDIKSYKEAYEMLQEEMKRKSDAHKSLEIAAHEALGEKNKLEDQVQKLRIDLTRAKEEQAELRYQMQQHMSSNSDTSPAQCEKTQQLEADLAAAKDALKKMEEKWKGRAQQAEEHFSRFQSDIQALKEKEAALVGEIDMLNEQVKNVEEVKTSLVEQLKSSDEARIKIEDELKARAQAIEDRCRRLQAELDEAQEHLAQTSESSHELIRVQHELDTLTLEKKQMHEEFCARELEWKEREEEKDRKSAFELSSFQLQCRETQEELEAYQKYANEEILKLRASVDENDAEVLQLTRTSKLREDALLAEVEHLKDELRRADEDFSVLEAKLKEREQSESVVINELSGKVNVLTKQLGEFEEDSAAAAQQYAQLKAAMEKLEGEDYQHRNELEEMAESLKSAQMEAMHYHNQLVEAQLAKDELEKVVATQKLRIDKLEKVKMTTETLELFRKLKSDRQDLQVQVQKLTAEVKELTASKLQTKEAAEQQHARLMRLKEEEISMFKTHVEELKSHIDELKRSLQSEKDKYSEARKEMQKAVQDIRDKAAQEVEDMQSVLKEKSDQVVELDEQMNAMQKSHLSSIEEHKTAKETYLEKENLELLVENRKLKKRLESRGVGEHLRHPVMTDDGADVYEASIRKASAALQESSPKSKLLTNSSEQNPPRSPSCGGLASFLMSSGSSSNGAGDCDDEAEARPACSQQ